MEHVFDEADTKTLKDAIAEEVAWKETAILSQKKGMYGKFCEKLAGKIIAQDGQVLFLPRPFGNASSQADNLKALSTMCTEDARNAIGALAGLLSLPEDHP